jgi:hypothetical protein
MLAKNDQRGEPDGAAHFEGRLFTHPVLYEQERLIEVGMRG